MSYIYAVAVAYIHIFRKISKFTNYLTLLLHIHIIYTCIC